eukprot:Sspe_Gene.1338::Locus_450_Transcript_2_2_Confidence_0.667_Length_1617::g.1338::m.1338
MEYPEATRSWKRLGSVVSLAVKVVAACDAGFPDEMAEACWQHAEGLRTMTVWMKNERSRLSHQVKEVDIIPLESQVAVFAELVDEWERLGAPPFEVMAAVMRDWGMRVTALVRRIGGQFVLPKDDRDTGSTPSSPRRGSPARRVSMASASPRRESLRRGPSPDFNRAEHRLHAEAHRSLQVSRSEVSVQGPLLERSPGEWVMYKGSFRGNDVAIKLFECERAFRRDLSALLRLSFHPNIPSVLAWASPTAPLDVDEDTSPLARMHLSLPSFDPDPLTDNPVLGPLPKGSLIVTEYVDGPLDEVAADRTLTPRLIQQILAQVLRALIHLHTTTPRPLVHGTVSSSTVLLQHDGHVKLSGVAGCMPADDESSPEKVLVDTCTNPCYQAPELLQVSGRVMTSVDVFSFGCLVFHLATRKEPPLDPTQAQETFLSAGLVEPWNSLALRCIHGDPASRPTVADLLALVENLTLPKACPEITVIPEPPQPTPHEATASTIHQELLELGCDPVTSLSDGTPAPSAFFQPCE